MFCCFKRKKVEPDPSQNPYMLDSQFRDIAINAEEENKRRCKIWEQQKEEKYRKKCTEHYTFVINDFLKEARKAAEQGHFGLVQNYFYCEPTLRHDLNSKYRYSLAYWVETELKQSFKKVSAHIGHEYSNVGYCHCYWLTVDANW